MGNYINALEVKKARVDAKAEWMKRVREDSLVI